MVKVRALMDFGGTVINRDDLGVVRKGDVIEVSENDAAYLERDELVERAADAAPAQAGDRSGAELSGKLPEDFPGRVALAAADITTYAQLRKHTGELTDIAGIGPATAEKIKDAISEPA